MESAIMPTITNKIPLASVHPCLVPLGSNDKPDNLVSAKNQNADRSNVLQPDHCNERPYEK